MLVTLAQVREAGVFRARLLQELAPPGFFATEDYDLLRVTSATRSSSPVRSTRMPSRTSAGTASAEKSSPFTPYDRDLLAYALRPLKWFHRRVMLHHGLLIARAPLTPMERRLMSLLLTERVEKEIAYELALTLATTHTYISGLFRKFGVSGRSGLTALWLGKPPA